MTDQTAIVGYAADDAAAEPQIRHIALADLKDALNRGYDDFRAHPSFAAFLALLYPVAGIALFGLTFDAQVFPLLFPLLSGFALIGPFAALGLYEISRRREQGLDTSWNHAADVLHSPARGAILALGGILTAIFVAWLIAAMAVWQMTFGDAAYETFGAFVSDVLTTPRGWTLIVLGNGLGLLFAVVALSISVVSFPLMLDRHADFGTAVKTSVRAVTANPGVMAVWGVIVAGGLVLGALPAFAGLAVVLPILAHASWHLYRKVVI